MRKDQKLASTSTGLGCTSTEKGGDLGILSTRLLPGYMDLFSEFSYAISNQKKPQKIESNIPFCTKRRMFD